MKPTQFTITTLTAALLAGGPAPALFAQCTGSSTDVFGVKMMFPTNGSGAKSWALGMDDFKTRMKDSQNVSGTGVNTTMDLNDKERNSVYATTPCDGITDHKKAAGQQYMCSPKDWKNFEMTCYFYTTNLGSDDFTMYGRGGRHTGSGYPDGCLGSAYKASIDINGRTRWGKEQWHVSYDYGGGGGWKSSGVSVNGKWVGYKIVVYNTGSASNPDVVVELWLDGGNNTTAPSNQWKLVNKVVDNGGWGADGAECGGANDQKIIWGGPLVTFRTDVGMVKIKWASVREIDPAGSFGMDVTAATAASCGSNSGSVTLDVAGGNAPFTYLWSNGATTKDISGLPSGTYIVEVTDANGCTGKDTVQVETFPDATPVIATHTTQTSFCEGDSLILSASQTFQSYLWSDYAGAPVSKLEPAQVSASGNDGNVPANTTDGDLITRWSNNGVGSWIMFDLGGQKYLHNVHIAWYNGNQRSSNFLIETSADGSSFSQVFAGASSGTTLNPEPYVFSPVAGRFVRITVNGNTVNDWASITEVIVNGQSGSTLQSVTVKKGGKYWVDVSNSDGCTGSDTIDIVMYSLPPVPVISASGNTLTATPAGYSYRWYLNGNLIAGATVGSHEATSPGFYTVVITDGNGCENTSDPYEVITTGLTAAGQGSIVVYPNPTGGSLRFEVSGFVFPEFHVQLYDAYGKLALNLEQQTSNLKPLDVSHLPDGIYFLVAESEGMRTTQKIIKKATPE